MVNHDTVLVADDDAAHQLLVKYAFERSGIIHPVRFVSDGAELLDYLYHRNAYTDPASSPMPGVILLDLNMPKKDGHEVLNEIKADPSLRKIPVVVMTTSSNNYDIAHSYELGANSFISKPMSFEGFVDVAQTVSKYWLQIVSTPTLSPERPVDSLTILIADDDPEDRMLIEEAFGESRLNNPLQFVEDGEELLDYLTHRGRFSDTTKYPKPGLILLDLNMPKKDGREALEEIKADSVLCKIPVVVMTTSKAEEDIVHSYELGVSAFITKPVSFKGLVDVVKTIGRFWFEIAVLPPSGDE